MQFPLGVPILEAEREDRKGNGRRETKERGGREGGEGRGREKRDEGKEKHGGRGGKGGERKKGVGVLIPVYSGL